MDINRFDLLYPCTPIICIYSVIYRDQKWGRIIPVRDVRNTQPSIGRDYILGDICAICKPGKKLLITICAVGTAQCVTTKKA